MPDRFLLLDRDGTLIVEMDNLHDPERVVLIPGAVDALKKFTSLGWRLAIVTNQSGVARKLFTIDQMHATNQKVVDLLASEGIVVEKVYACTHGPEIEDCDCRKPKPGLIQQAIEDFGFDPRESIVVGDKTSDVGLGKNVGARTVLVRTGYGASAQNNSHYQPDFVIDSLADLNPDLVLAVD